MLVRTGESKSFLLEYCRVGMFAALRLMLPTYGVFKI